MKPIIKALSLLVFATLLSSCGQSAPGPNTWLDRPLDGMHFAIEPIILHAHASDANGISAMLFYVDGELVADIPCSRAQLGEAIFRWNPTEAGTYTISAVGVDTLSRRGSTASAVITVGEIAPLESLLSPDTEVDTPTPTPEPGISTEPPGPAPTRTSTPTPIPPPTHTPTPTPTPDTTGPEILLEVFLGQDSTPITYMVGGSPSGCDNNRILTHSIWLNDPAGIWSVWVDWTTDTQSGTVYYDTNNGYVFNGEFGPLSSSPSTLTANGRANDIYGNWTPISFSMPVVSCID
jgi:hypothetical protein